ncbi:Pfam:DUF23 [Seminavis robusta]|uniref:Pfam:DUF23 n=1 Tax=Seminavis robusta TaxID=568900 RepID=A0A9N8HVG7_9STRA|nr:Pfam:DUF23 [Seminavis robusta]|eukprot:Sro1943_g306860.1 Pfam:DUF23 (843) ;mRNA; f:13745-16380
MAMSNPYGAAKQVKRNLGSKNGQQRKKAISPTMLFGLLFFVVIGIYATVVAWFSSATSSPLHNAPAANDIRRRNSITTSDSNANNINDIPPQKLQEEEESPPQDQQEQNGNNGVESAEEKGLKALQQIVKQEKRQPIVKRFRPKPKGDGIKPQALVAGSSNNQEEQPQDQDEVHPDPEHIMKAFVEPIRFEDWEVKPLPLRTSTTAKKHLLEEIAFPKVNSCKRLPERWPADEYPDQDTFLPWIHDVFPTDDGKFIQIVAQNRRRCHTGTTEEELRILVKTQPSVALFQHVPVKRITDTNGNPRYQLCPHEDADPDGVATRFICRFKPTMEETLSVFNFDYDWAAFRKKQRHTFKFDDGGIKSVHTSQLIFKCPVPEGLQESIKSGDAVQNDFATIFMDLIPIRTPPRYGAPNMFFQPRYNESLVVDKAERFDADMEWGKDHILPKIEDSGRWENIPICRTSLKEYYPDNDDNNDNNKKLAVPGKPDKKHRLVSCIWGAAGYSTRGNRFAINDGQRRLLEWIHFNKMLGFDHFYLYDNSYAFSNEITLKPIADLFPGEVTYIKWPFQICNNNPNNVDSPGERSSQYAAESSCRLRFGPHVEWIGQYDIDEYIVPMGSYTSILPILDNLDKEGKKIISFGSWRSWPRRDFIAEPEPIDDPQACGKREQCFNLQVPLKHTMLQAYNCDRQSGPKKKVMPAEKQIYKPEYVRQHFIHYSSVTALSELSKSEFEKAGYNWQRTRAFPDPLSRFGDELHEATMLHTKAVATPDTTGWLKSCMDKYNGHFMCRIGVPFPDDYDEKKHGTADETNWAYNCYPNKRIDGYWAPLLEEAINKEHGHMFQQQ